MEHWLFRSGNMIIPYLLLFKFIAIIHGHEFKGFDDTILYNINWPGKSSTPDLLNSQQHVEHYYMTSERNEKYQCSIPDTTKSGENPKDNYTGLNPIEILSPLFKQKICSYRLESYWTYELCHGRYVRQYHEEREGNKLKLQEYHLGVFDKIDKLSAEYDEYKLGNRRMEIPMKKVDGINMSYVEIEMKDGTVCDLNSNPRSIKVLYVCYQHGNHEIFSLKETSSCEYEAVVLSPLLCNHPNYKPQDSRENEIVCRPVNNAPKKPKSLLVLEAKSFELRQGRTKDDTRPEVYTIFHIEEEGQDGETRVRVETRHIDVIGKQDSNDAANLFIDQGLSLERMRPVKNFLNGKNCLNGGNGWWKYEFCYGKSVVQYHLEKDGTKTTVNLGKFDKQKHIKWIGAHPHKKPKPKKLKKREEIIHFYSDGSVCDKTGKLRQTEVKLKCVKNPTGSQSSVSLFLLEPKTCEYILGVESPLICEILQFADDEYGLINDEFPLNISNMKRNTQQEDDEVTDRIP